MDSRSVPGLDGVIESVAQRDREAASTGEMWGGDRG